MKNNDRILRYILYAALLGVGIILGMALVSFWHMSEFESINLIDLATLISTIFLAVYIPEVLNRRLEIKREKKGLVEERIEEIQALYRKINLLVQGEKPIKQKDYLEIKNTLDISEHKLDTISKLVNSSNFALSFLNEMKEIKRLCHTYKELLWSPQMESEGFSYPDDILEKEEVLYTKIDEATCLMIFKISEA